MKSFLWVITILMLLCHCSILWADDTQPKELKAVGGDGVIYLSWSPPKDGAKGYWVYRALPNGTYERVTPYPLEKPFYEDRDVINGQYYWYRVKAIDSEGKEGIPSTRVWALPNPHDKPLRGY